MEHLARPWGRCLLLEGLEKPGWVGDMIPPCMRTRLMKNCASGELARCCNTFPDWVVSSEYTTWSEIGPETRRKTKGFDEHLTPESSHFDLTCTYTPLRTFESTFLPESFDKPIFSRGFDKPFGRYRCSSCVTNRLGMDRLRDMADRVDWISPGRGGLCLSQL